MTISFGRHQFPPAIIRHAVWLYVRFTLSYRDVEDLLAERGLDVSCETVRRWATLPRAAARISAATRSVSHWRLLGKDRGRVRPFYAAGEPACRGKPYRRSCPINNRMKLTFETDARDDSFRRRIERGNFSLFYLDKASAEVDASYVGPNLKSGIASVMASLPDDVEVGDALTFGARVQDSRASFENWIEISVRPPAEHHGGGQGGRKPPQPKPGHERETPRQLATPQIERVYREQWEAQSPAFDEFTALRVEVTGYEGEEDSEVYEFKINMDNTPLLNEIKQRRLDDVPARNQS
jgi:hypothetical protein